MDAPTVLVVGAGPTGLVAALTLAMNGARCRLIDRRASPIVDSRALGCQPRSMEILAALGVAELIQRNSEPLAGSVVMRGPEALVTIAWVPPDAPYPYTSVFRQPVLEEVLRNRLAELGVNVEWDTEFAGLDDQGMATLANGQHVVANWIVGCDGAHSRVRESAAIDFAGRSTGETHYLADVSFQPEDPVPGPAMWLAPEGPLMLMRLPGRPSVWRMFIDVTGDGPQLPEPTRESLQALMDRRALGPGRAIIDTVHWTSIYRTSIRLAHSYCHERVFLAGDAAHVFPPYGGQGMNTGIQDAFNLGWKLARVVRGSSSSAILETYEAERRPVAIETIRQVDRRRRMYAVRSPFWRALRDQALKTLMPIEAVKRAGSYATSELGITYHRRSWLCIDDGRVPRPWAGDRAPDGPLGDRRLFDMLRPSQFTLLLFAGGNAPPATLPQLPSEVVLVNVDRVADPDGALARRYKAERGALVLIRPDGHIGFRGGPDSYAALRSFLNKLLDFNAEAK
jgi:2-polyprenyl-6-methoxyphenol hydroxylase-like FAD-dependent oxidoreductase